MTPHLHLCFPNSGVTRMYNCTQQEVSLKYRAHGLSGQRITPQTPLLQLPLPLITPGGHTRPAAISHTHTLSLTTLCL